MVPAREHVDINGIPAYTADIGVPFTGTLTFGVGRRDESAPTAGTAHLLEHLVMHRVGKVNIPHNAHTDDETISFFAQGNPALVADFLSRVAGAVSTLHETTDTEVTEQRRIIAAELGDGDERPGRGALLDRFGAQSIGLLDLGSPGHRSLTRARVLSFADTWLHAANAALAFTGPVPEGLDLTLPPSRPVPRRDAPTVIRDGAWVANGPIPLCVSMVVGEVENRNAAVVATVVMEQALFSDLRTAKQLVYSVQPFVAALSRESRFVAYSLDPRPDAAVPTAVAALDVIRRLGADGPTEEMVRDALDEWSQAMEDPGAQADSLDGLVTAVLRGRRERNDVTMPDLSSVTADDVRHAVMNSLPSIFVTFGDDVLSGDGDAVTEALNLPFVDLPLPLYAKLGKGELFKRLMSSGVETFNPRMFRGMRGAQFVIDHDRIACISPDGIMEIAYDDVALAAYSETHRFWAVLAIGGDLIVLDRDDWRGEAKAHALLEDRLPKDRQIRVDMGAS